MILTEATAKIALKNILFPTDLSVGSEKALLFAESVARRYGSKLIAAHVISPLETSMVPPEGWGACQQALDEAATFQMGELERRMPKLPHECLVEQGLVGDVISELIEEKDADLLIMGTHGRSGLDRLLMGSVAEEAFREAPCPVLTIGPKVPAQAPQEAEFKHIVLATDFHPGSQALTYALSLAQEFQALLTIVHIVPQAARTPENFESIVEARTRNLRALVEPEADLWCTPEYVVRFGSAAEGILEIAAEKQADLIVLGARSAGRHIGAATHAIAATAHTVVSQAHCPVLTVRDTAS
jgi:nucleotide-binding universal stress UspA family protein